MIKIDDKTVNEIYKSRDNDQAYMDVAAEYKNALKTNDIRKIDNAVIFMEAIAADVIYKKAFHDGMSFILKALAGKEVLDI